MSLNLLQNIEWLSITIMIKIKMFNPRNPWPYLALVTRQCPRPATSAVPHIGPITLVCFSLHCNTNLFIPFHPLDQLRGLLNECNILGSFALTIKFRGKNFPGGPVVKNAHANARVRSLVPEDAT